MLLRQVRSGQSNPEPFPSTLSTSAKIAAWFGGNVKVIGVEPEAAPTLSMALKAGGPVDAPAGGIAADSLAPRRVGTHVYPIAKRHVNHVVLVPDDEINLAQLVFNCVEVRYFV
jgi:threonine dehydratase